jgi:hypothetical protein
MAIGMRVRFFMTSNKANGQYNAATGTIVGFNTLHTEVRGVRIQLDRNNQITTVHRMAPVRLVLNRYLSIAYWPLAPAYASTTHSVQGASIATKVAIDLRHRFAPGLAYTALSRNTNTDDILLRKPLTVHDLRVLNLPAFYIAQAAGEQPQPFPHLP